MDDSNEFIEAYQQAGDKSGEISNHDATYDGDDDVSYEDDDLVVEDEDDDGISSDPENAMVDQETGSLSEEEKEDYDYVNGEISSYHSEEGQDNSHAHPSSEQVDLLQSLLMPFAQSNEPITYPEHEQSMVELNAKWEEVLQEALLEQQHQLEELAQEVEQVELRARADVEDMRIMHEDEIVAIKEEVLEQSQKVILEEMKVNAERERKSKEELESAVSKAVAATKDEMIKEFESKISELQDKLEKERASNERKVKETEIRVRDDLNDEMNRKTETKVGLMKSEYDEMKKQIVDMTWEMQELQISFERKLEDAEEIIKDQKTQIENVQGNIDLRMEEQKARFEKQIQELTKNHQAEICQVQKNSTEIEKQLETVILEKDEEKVRAIEEAKNIMKKWMESKINEVKESEAIKAEKKEKELEEEIQVLRESNSRLSATVDEKKAEVEAELDLIRVSEVGRGDAQRIFDEQLERLKQEHESELEILNAAFFEEKAEEIANVVSNLEKVKRERDIAIMKLKKSEENKMMETKKLETKIAEILASTVQEKDDAVKEAVRGAESRLEDKIKFEVDKRLQVQMEEALAIAEKEKDAAIKDAIADLESRFKEELHSAVAEGINGHEDSFDGSDDINTIRKMMKMERLMHEEAIQKQKEDLDELHNMELKELKLKLEEAEMRIDELVKKLETPENAHINENGHDKIRVLKMNGNHVSTKDAGTNGTSKVSLHSNEKSDLVVATIPSALIDSSSPIVRALSPLTPLTEDSAEPISMKEEKFGTSARSKSMEVSSAQVNPTTLPSKQSQRVRKTSIKKKSPRRLSMPIESKASKTKIETPPVSSIKKKSRKSITYQRSKVCTSHATISSAPPQDVKLLILNVPSAEKLKKMAMSLKVDVVNDPVESTHVIAGNSSTSMRRTPRLMGALCVTPYILKSEWIEDSYKNRSLLSCNHYLLLKDRTAEEIYSFSMKLTLREGNDRRKEGGLLAGWRILFCKDVAGNKAPRKEDLHMMVKCAGGTLISLSDIPLTSTEDNTHILVITSSPPSSKQTSDKKVKEVAENGAGFFTISWLFDCMMHQKLSGIKRGLGR